MKKIALCHVKIHWGLSFTLNRSSEPSWCCNVAHGALGKHWCPDLCPSSKWWPLLAMRYLHVTFVNSTANLMGSLSPGSHQAHSGESDFPNFWFLLEISDIIIGKKWVPVVLLKVTGSLCSFSGRYLLNAQLYITMVCPSFCQEKKNRVPWKSESQPV